MKSCFPVSHPGKRKIKVENKDWGGRGESESGYIPLSETWFVLIFKCWNVRIWLCSTIGLVWVIQRGGWLERNLRKDGASGATRGEEHLRPAEKQPQEKPAAEAAVWLQHWLSLVEEYERHISEPTWDNTTGHTGWRHFSRDTFVLGPELLQFEFWNNGLML